MVLAIFLIVFSFLLQMFLSALIDVAGHAGNVDGAFEILHKVSNRGVHAGIISYSSLMGACCNVCITKAITETFS